MNCGVESEHRERTEICPFSLLPVSFLHLSLTPAFGRHRKEKAKEGVKGLITSFSSHSPLRPVFTNEKETVMKGTEIKEIIASLLSVTPSHSFIPSTSPINPRESGLGIGMRDMTRRTNGEETMDGLCPSLTVFYQPRREKWLVSE